MPNYILPNWATQTDSSAYKNSIDAAAAKHDLLAGQFYAHEAAVPDMTVVVDAGKLMYAGVLNAQPQQTTAIIIAPVTNPRIDRIVIDQVTGVAEIAAGTEAVSPVVPGIPAGKIAVCQILLGPSTVTITNSLITNEIPRIYTPPEPVSVSVELTHSVATSVSAGSIIEFDTATIMSSGSFIFSAYTPGVAGYYTVSINLSGSASSLNAFKAEIRKNGVAVRRVQETNVYTGPVVIQLSGTVTVYMNGVSDYIEVYNASSITIGMNAGIDRGLTISKN